MAAVQLARPEFQPQLYQETQLQQPPPLEA